MDDPDFETELETITPMKAGRGPAGGGVLLPGSVVQFVAQLDTGGLFSTPLKLGGAGPLLKLLSVAHRAPQKVTLRPMEALPSPITKSPLAGVPKIRIVLVALAVLPPSSTIFTVTVKNP